MRTTWINLFLGDQESKMALHPKDQQLHWQQRHRSRPIKDYETPPHVCTGLYQCNSKQSAANWCYKVSKRRISKCMKTTKQIFQSSSRGQTCKQQSTRNCREFAHKGDKDNQDSEQGQVLNTQVIGWNKSCNHKGGNTQETKMWQSFKNKREKYKIKSWQKP